LATLLKSLEQPGCYLGPHHWSQQEHPQFVYMPRDYSGPELTRGIQAAAGLRAEHRNAEPNENPNEPRHESSEPRDRQEVSDREDNDTHTNGLSQKKRRR
jgi:hypothetical protein